MTAVEILEATAADAPQFPALLATTAQSFNIAEVSADKAYCSNKNMEIDA